MIWTIEFVPDALKELKKLDRSIAARIIDALEHKIASRPDPRELGAPLKGTHEGYWRWRIGDYRVVGLVEDALVKIVVIRIAHRRHVYR